MHQENPPPRSLVAELPPKGLAEPRTVMTVAEELRSLVTAGTLDLPLPGEGDTAARWSALCELGRRDLVLARLAEGHTDATAILAEAGAVPEPNALYGVWASRSGGTGAELVDGRASGLVRFCSGSSALDRALVVADERLVEVDLGHEGVHAHPETWRAVGMDVSDSGDVVLDGVPVERTVGGRGWYVRRRGFALGGAGVAAVWLGGAVGVVDRVVEFLRDRGHVDDHQAAHLGALRTAIAATDALLVRTAGELDDGRAGGSGDAGTALVVDLARAAAESTARDVLDRAPRVVGPVGLTRDRDLPRRLADLQVYVRQHHGERDLASIGRHVVDGGAR
ncbi:acyl-CoA dehydrogenase family protein [Actinoalloteichus spitiensis]|uniref:acyl-CoA dehydrogenase family protein n=1 Tax=Actinoalloteichus spitiensis TaxID=252394 RepID=UPI0012F6DC67|nr:acyl-CoA dehydrogenase family protein [Actinoalloteichus spitiensis]